MIRIEIKNWTKYNPKRAQKTYTWLRLDNDLPNDPKLFCLNPEQKWLWICLLCLTSKHNEGHVEISVEWLSHHSGVKDSQIVKALESMKKVGLLHFTTPDYTRLHDTTPTDGRTNETNETDGRTPATAHDATDFDLLEIYAAYPRKRGKAEGLRILQKSVKTRQAFFECLNAATNYAFEVQGTDPQFRKHFPTWCRRWRDWIAVEEDTPARMPKAKNEALIRRILAEGDE